jgi:pimeloyl-ACP methyl ester carboxylesterase
MANIAHTRRGTGSPPVVFVHGFGCAQGDWHAQVEQLASRHETVTVDLGAHGRSPGTAEHARIETHGADVTALLQHLKLPRVILVGHSMGCRVVIEAALAAPEHVLGLVMVDGSRLATPGSDAQETIRRQLAEVGYAGFIRPLFAAMFSPAYDKAKAEFLIARAVAMPADIAAPLFADISRWDAERMDAAFASLSVPLMLIQTTYQDERRQRRSLEQGQSTPYLDYVKATVPSARIEVIPGTGHFPQLETPAVVSTLLDDFARGL